MAQPPHIPKTRKKPGKKQTDKRLYSSPKYVPKPWHPDRPGDVADAGNPRADGFGAQGPDQGYILKLASGFSGQLILERGELEDDIVAGCARLALKRASALGRAPLKEDLEVSFMILGFLYTNPPPELLELRRELLRGAAHSSEVLQGRVAPAVSFEVLKLMPEEIKERQRADWKSLFDI